MRFLTLEDGAGRIDVVIPAGVYEKYRMATRATFVMVEGILQAKPGEARSVRALKVVGI